MKLAVTVWNKRIAPVFDCAGTALLLDVEEGACGKETALDISHVDLASRVRILRDRGAEVLICGAISCEAERLVRGAGIAVHPFIAGDVPTVIQAWLQDELGREEFSMPGCGRARNRRGQGHGRCRGISSVYPQ
jgi:predicted Fe-Mo cluster-binding NifX family protein